MIQYHNYDKINYLTEADYEEIRFSGKCLRFLDPPMGPEKVKEFYVRRHIDSTGGLLEVFTYEHERFVWHGFINHNILSLLTNEELRQRYGWHGDDWFHLAALVQIVNSHFTSIPHPSQPEHKMSLYYYSY